MTVDMEMICLRHKRTGLCKYRVSFVPVQGSSALYWLCSMYRLAAIGCRTLTWHLRMNRPNTSSPLHGMGRVHSSRQAIGW